MTADPLLIETVERLLASICTFETVERAEGEGWCGPVWDALADGGFPWIGVPEAAGGSGGSVFDAMALLRCAGRHAAPVPLAETGTAAWLLATAGLPIPDGALSVVPVALTVDGYRVTGESAAGWAARAERVVALAGGEVVSLRGSSLTIEPAKNMAGEPLDRVRVDVAFDDVEHAPAAVAAEDLRRRIVLGRIALMSGAVERLAELTVAYANDRKQFGQPIARFQAVQQHLVTVAQSAVTLSMAADVAIRDPAFVGHAAVVADEAAVAATRAAHQVHGAMGMTREYPLHHLSRRLWAWRHELGRAAEWRLELGREAVSAGADALFPSVTR